MKHISIQLSVLIASLILVNGGYTPIYEDMMRPLTEECQDCVGATEEDMIAVYMYQSLETQTQACLQYCVYHKLGLMNNIHFAPQERMFAVYRKVHEGRERELQSGNDLIQNCVAEVDGSYCLTGGSDRKLKLWNPFRSLALKTYEGHGQEVLDVCGSCDNSQIVSCSSDKSVILWDVTTGRILRRFRGHAAAVMCVRFNEESFAAVSGSQDNAVMCWDVRNRTNEPIQVLRDAKDTVTSVQVTDHEILSGSVDCSVRRYDLRAGELVSDFIGKPVTSVSLTHDGQGIIVSSSDDKIRLIDKDTGELLGEYEGHKTGDYLINSCSDNTDKNILSGSTDGKVWCWDLVDGTVSHHLTHQTGVPVSSLCAHPRKPFLLSAASTNVKLWGDHTVLSSDSDTD